MGIVQKIKNAWKTINGALNLSSKSKVDLAASIVYGLTTFYNPAALHASPGPRIKGVGERYDRVGKFYSNPDCEVSPPRIYHSTRPSGELTFGVEVFGEAYGEVNDKECFNKQVKSLMQDITGADITKNIIHFEVEDTNRDNVISVGDRGWIGFLEEEVYLLSFPIDEAILAYIYPAYGFKKEWILKETKLAYMKNFWRNRIDLYKEILEEHAELLPNFLQKEQYFFFNNKVKMEIAKNGDLLFTKLPSGKTAEYHNYYQFRYLFNVISSNSGNMPQIILDS